MSKARSQMPQKSGRVEAAHGEAVGESVSDEARDPLAEHRDTGPAKTKAGTGGLLEAALARENMQMAWERVKANKGAAGVDGRDIEQTAQDMRTLWPQTRKELLAGTYRPSPVRKVLIPKADGSQRELGIPTVLDRLIQQALLQVLQPRIDPGFSNHSHGFRPGRRAHDAVKAARAYVQSGKRVVVDVDLEKFFDRVNHDILIDRLGKRIEDNAVMRLIRAYLNAGIMDGGVVMERQKGTPQGGPLSPLLANVLLDEVDKALEVRGYDFARYADDCNVYVGSQKAGERGDGLSEEAVHQTQTSNQRSQECGRQRLRAQIPGIFAVGGKGQRGQVRSSQKGTGKLQDPNTPTHTPQWRAQHEASGRKAQALSAGMEGLLRVGANTKTSGASWKNGCATA